MALATGQFTIIDYNDALTLTGFIGTNLAKTQMYNPDNNTYSPDWTKTNMVLTPSLYKMGTTTDLITSASIKSVKWYDGSSQITSGGSYSISGSKSHILTIKGNVLSGLPGKDYTVEITYHDDTTNMDLTYKTGITFSRVVNGGGITDAIAWAPNGNVFKNDDVASLICQCDLWRGSVEDTTNVSYQWYINDTSVTTDQGGGVGWRKLTNTANRYSGVTTSKLTIYPTAVASFAVFKCVITDTDSTSSTYNQKFVDTISVIDNSDPIQISVTSSGGDVFKNGIGSTTLTAKLFQAGNEVDTAGTKYTYKWYKYDKDGNLVSNFGGTSISYKSGKTLNVGDADVDVKATFQIEID